MYCIGCDLHSKRMQLCLVDDEAEHEGYPLPEEAVLIEEEIATGRATLGEWIEKADRMAPGPKAVAVETTCNWDWFVDFVEPRVEEVHLVHANRARAIAQARAKTDKIDARILAWLLKNDLVPDVFIPSLQAREMRDVFRHRSYLMKQRTSLKNRVHSILLKQGIQRHHSDLFGPGGRAFLAELELSGPRQRVLQDSLDMIDHFSRTIEDIDAYLDAHPKRPAPMARRLKTLPGFGDRLAMHVALEIIDIERFASQDRFVSYCGLAPGTHRSQDSERRRGLLPHGNRYLKWAYSHGATHAARHRYFRRTHQRQVAKNGKMIARLTTARKMAICTYQMLTKGEDFLGGA